MKKTRLLIIFCSLTQTVLCQGTYIVALQEAYNEFKRDLAKENADVMEAGKKGIKNLNKADKPYKKNGWCNTSYYKALVYENVGEYDKALVELDDCTPGSFHQDEIEQRMVLKGKILEMQDKYELALDAYLKAQIAYEKQTHKLANNYYYAGPIKQMYAKMGDYENAIKYNNLSDTSYGIRATLSYIYHKYLAEKNIRIKWEDLFTEAQQYDKTGNRTMAYEKYTEAINLNELYAEAYYYRGILGLKMSKYAEASNDLNKCFNDLNHQFPRLNFLVYISLEAAGNFKADYYSFYDKYPASERTNLLKEFGITGSSKFVSKEERDREIARQQKAWDEKKSANTSPSPVVTPATTETRCTCDRCNGSGKISVSSFKTWEISNGTDKYGNAKTIKKSGYVYEDQTCTKCLGSGKCK